MKKIGLWMPALTAVTVGGVYAAWTYAEGSVSPQSTDKAIQMEGYVDAGAVGEYTLTPTANAANTAHAADMFYFDSYKAVDPVNGVSDPHQAVLVTNCSVVFTFTYNENAEQYVRDHGLDSTITISISNPDVQVTLEEGTIDIFSLKAPIVIKLKGKVGDTEEAGYKQWTQSADGKSYSYSISLEEMKELIANNFVIHNDVNLENVAEWTAFDTAVSGLTIKTAITPTAESN